MIWKTRQSCLDPDSLFHGRQIYFPTKRSLVNLKKISTTASYWYIVRITRHQPHRHSTALPSKHDKLSQMSVTWASHRTASHLSLAELISLACGCGGAHLEATYRERSGEDWNLKMGVGTKQRFDSGAAQPSDAIVENRIFIDLHICRLHVQMI